MLTVEPLYTLHSFVQPYADHEEGDHPYKLERYRESIRRIGSDLTYIAMDVGSNPVRCRIVFLSTLSVSPPYLLVVSLCCADVESLYLI